MKVDYAILESDDFLESLHVQYIHERFWYRALVSTVSHYPSLNNELKKKMKCDAKKTPRSDETKMAKKKSSKDQTSSECCMSPR